MLRNTKTKILLSLFLIITLISTFSFAENETTDETTSSIDSATTSEATTEEETSTISESEETESSSTNSQDIHEGDLYLSGEDVTMDKLVNGNVYIMANNATITGQIAGNLFILANKVTFTDAYIESSVYLCANETNFKAVASDLYACCNTLEIPTDYGVYRDLKCYSNSLTILGIIGRNVDCNITSLILEKDESKANIYGDLQYSSTKEIELPEGAIQGETSFTPIVTNNDNSNKLTDYLINAVKAVVFTLVVYGLALLFSKNSIEKCTKITKNKFLPAFGIGLLALIVVPIVSILLLISIVGVSVSLVLLLAYILLLSISVSTLVISIANIIAEKMKISNTWLKVLCVAIISLLAYILEVIPYGIILRILFIAFGFGILIMNMFFKNINFEKKDKTNKSEK